MRMGGCMGTDLEDEAAIEWKFLHDISGKLTVAVGFLSLDDEQAKRCNAVGAECQRFLDLKEAWKSLDEAVRLLNEYRYALSRRSPRKKSI